MSPISKRRARRHCHAGQTMPELAVVVVVLVVLLFAIIKMGIVVYRYNMVCSAAREAVRYAIVNPSDITGIQNTAINSAPFLTSSNITIYPSVTDPNDATQKDAKVTVSYPYTIQIPLIPSISLTLASSSQMMRSQ